MRSMLDIAIAVSECQTCTDQELRYAVAAWSAMEGLVERELDDLAEAITERPAIMYLKAGFAKKGREVRLKGKRLPVDQYLGNHAPGHPEQQCMLKLGKKIYKAATGDDLAQPPAGEGGG